MADSRARRKALRGREIRVVELVFDTRTSFEPEDIRHEGGKKERFVEVCLKNVENHLERARNPRADAELAEFEATTQSDCTKRGCVQRKAKRVFDILGSELAGGEWAKFLGFPLELAAAEGDQKFVAKLVEAEEAIASAVHAAVRGGSEEMVDFPAGERRVYRRPGLSRQDSSPRCGTSRQAGDDAVVSAQGG